MMLQYEHNFLNTTCNIYKLIIMTQLLILYVSFQFLDVITYLFPGGMDSVLLH
jgi:hypothetical protein